MGRGTAKALGYISFGLAVGFCAGWLLGRKRADISGIKNYEAKLAVEDSKIGNPAALPPALSASPRDSKPRQISNVDLLKKLVRLEKTNGIWFNLQALVRPKNHRGYQISPAFVQLFELTPTEEATLNQALDDAGKQQYALELAHATSRLEDNGQKVVIDVPAFPQDGGKIYDQLHQTFATTLGPDRQPLFDDFADQQVENSLDNFGAEERTITILRKTSPNGSVTYSTQYAETGANGTATGNGTFFDRAGLVQYFPVAAPVLPADY